MECLQTVKTVEDVAVAEEAEEVEAEDVAAEAEEAVEEAEDAVEVVMTMTTKMIRMMTEKLVLIFQSSEPLDVKQGQTYPKCTYLGIVNPSVTIEKTVMDQNGWKKISQTGETVHS